jgi:hypothetical protein
MIRAHFCRRQRISPKYPEPGIHNAAIHTFRQPALGMGKILIGTHTHFPEDAKICTGPMEQFTPMTSRRYRKGNERLSQARRPSCSGVGVKVMTR